MADKRVLPNRGLPLYLDCSMSPVRFGRRTMPLVLASITFLVAVGAWYGAGIALRKHETRLRGDSPLREAKSGLHPKIEQLLTEARVILPGAQALLGFQLIVMMSKAFGDLPSSAQCIHLIALMSLVLAVVLLIAPAAIRPGNRVLTLRRLVRATADRSRARPLPCGSNIAQRVEQRRVV